MGFALRFCGEILRPLAVHTLPTELIELALHARPIKALPGDDVGFFRALVTNSFVRAVDDHSSEGGGRLIWDDGTFGNVDSEVGGNGGVVQNNVLVIEPAERLANTISGHGIFSVGAGDDWKNLSAKVGILEEWRKTVMGIELLRRWCSVWCSLRLCSCWLMFEKRRFFQNWVVFVFSPFPFKILVDSSLTWGPCFLLCLLTSLSSSQVYFRSVGRGPQLGRLPIVLGRRTEVVFFGRAAAAGIPSGPKTWSRN
jgi:hypothetical protein